MICSFAAAWRTAMAAGAALASSAEFAGTPSDPSLLSQPPRQGAAGGGYLADVFAQTCVAKRDTLDELVHVADVPGWSGAFDKVTSTYLATTGRDGWPTISVKATPNGTSCVVAWTIDPNTGVGSAESAVEEKLGIKLEGQRVTSGPGQTVFNGTDAIGNANPHIILYENVSPKRASFQLTLIGRMSGQ